MKGLRSLRKQLQSNKRYFVDLFTCLWTSLYEESSSDFLQIRRSLFWRDLPFIFQILFGSQNKEDCFLMSVLPCLLDPVSQFLKGTSRVDGVDKENSWNPFVEIPDQCFEELLSCLVSISGTVSHICSLTLVWGFTGTTLDEYSTPTVTWYCSLKSPLINLVMRLVFPTPEWVLWYPVVPVRWFWNLYIPTFLSSCELFIRLIGRL